MKAKTILAAVMLLGIVVIAGAMPDQPNMQAARGSLITARNELQRATADKGGHRANAIGLVNSAIAEVNASKYGLQAGVFTNDINRAFDAHRRLEVGGVIINDVSAFRADQMPYGGSKDSGFGREGLRFAMEEMTEPRIMVLSHVPL